MIENSLHIIFPQELYNYLDLYIVSQFKMPSYCTEEWKEKKIWDGWQGFHCLLLQRAPFTRHTGAAQMTIIESAQIIILIGQQEDAVWCHGQSQKSYFIQCNKFYHWEFNATVTIHSLTDLSSDRMVWTYPGTEYTKLVEKPIVLSSQKGFQAWFP